MFYINSLLPPLYFWKADLGSIHKQYIQEFSLFFLSGDDVCFVYVNLSAILLQGIMGLYFVFLSGGISS